MRCLTRRTLPAAVCAAALSIVAATPSWADNNRLNSGVVAGVYTVRYQAGCEPAIGYDRQLQQAARRHTLDVLTHPDLDGDLGSDGSTTQDRAAAEGFTGRVSQTVAINPALAINNLDVITQWFDDPRAHAIMADCANTRIGVWSENSLARSVVVAVYGRPA